MDDNYIKQIQQNEDRSKSNTKRLDEHTARLDKLEDTYSMLTQMDYRMGQVEQAVEKIDYKLDNQQEKKGLKWDKFIDYIFYTILAFALIKLGLK